MKVGSIFIHLNMCWKYLIKPKLFSHYIPSKWTGDMVGKVLLHNLHYGSRPPTPMKAIFQHTCIYKNRGLGGLVTWPRMDHLILRGRGYPISQKKKTKQIFTQWRQKQTLLSTRDKLIFSDPAKNKLFISCKCTSSSFHKRSLSVFETIYNQITGINVKYMYFIGLLFYTQSWWWSLRLRCLQQSQLKKGHGASKTPNITANPSQEAISLNRAAFEQFPRWHSQVDSWSIFMA